MTSIRIQVSDQTLVILDAPLVASGGVLEDRVNVVFDSSWNDYSQKVAVFYQNEATVYEAVLNALGEATIPAAVLATPGRMFIGVYGVSGDAIKTTEVQPYRVVQGALTSGTTPPAPQQDIYQQLLNKFSAVRTCLTDIKGLLSSGVFTSDVSAQIAELTTHILEV